MAQSSEFPSFPNDCKSLLSKYLTEDIFEQLQNTKTEYGFTLNKAINSGVKNPDSGIGVYAGDSESYTCFAPLFDSIIKEYHGFNKEDLHQSNLNANDLIAPNPDPEGKYILSTRIRVGRNFANMPLGPSINKEQRDEVEAQSKEALNALNDELKGTYFPISGMNEVVKENLIQDHFLFKAGDRFLEAAYLNENWPSGRGIFHNDEKTFLVWVNEEDQLRIISMQQGGDIKEVFKRLTLAISKLEEKLTFSYDDHLGYITSCPTNLGTAMRASVHIKLPNLGENMETFEKITNKHYLQIRGIHGEHSDSVGGIYDISNKRRLGVTEVQCVQDMHDGVVALINAEKELEKK